MNRKHTATLTAIFRDPASWTIPYTEIESLLLSLGCKLIADKGNGSAVLFIRDGKRLSFHRPHPRKEVKAYVVRNVRDFLISIGENP